MATMRFPLLAAIPAFVLLLAPASRAADRQYVSMAFHDVVDTRTDADEYDVTTGELVAFFEWLRGNNWTAITLDDIARAKSGERPLPARAILITFDDGYSSLYTRVYPLVKAYRVPIVASLICQFLDAKADEVIRHGTDDGVRDSGVRASGFITWAEAREMDASGLVEFASHGYDLHHSNLANPLGGELPVDAARLWNASTGYETEDAFRQRIRADLQLSRSAMQRELGRFPRALAWPFGRYTRVGQEEALAAHFEFTLTLDPELGTPADLPLVPRMLPLLKASLAQVITDAVSGIAKLAAVRMVRLDPGSLSWRDPAEFEKALGAVVERVRAMGVNWVVVDAAARGASGKLEAAWFPNRVLPVKADVLSRIVWQLRTRAGVTVALSLPVDAAREALGSDAAVERLYQDMGVAALADAVLLEHATESAAIHYENSFSARREDIRRRRSALDLSRLPAADALAMRCFFAFERERPERRLILSTASPGETPSAVADFTLVEAPPEEKPFRELVERLEAAGWLAEPWRYRSGIWMRYAQPPSPAALSTAVRFFQQHGGVVFGWEPDDLGAGGPKGAVDSMDSLRIALATFCFGYPFVMAWYWMAGGLLYWWFRERHEPLPAEVPLLSQYPLVSILVPCYNEQDQAEETFAALAHIDYPEYEILAINDGSRDGTAEILEQLAARIPQLRVIQLKQNQGKARALNAGAMLARGEFLVCIDGDALLDRTAVTWFIRRMLSDGRLGGITGNPRLRNRSSLLGQLQVGEFSSIVGLIKRSQTILGWLFTVSGVICCFRKRALQEAGWWSAETLTDDVELTWRLQISGWHVAYEAKAMCWILMPETLRGLWRQRVRWSEGGTQAVLVSTTKLLRAGRWRAWFVWSNYVLSVFWAYLMVFGIFGSLLQMAGVPPPGFLPVFGLMPHWAGVVLAVTYLAQAVISVGLDKRFEKQVGRAVFWVVWYPLVFWMLQMATAVAGFPRAFWRMRHPKGTWTSPDRGIV